MQPDSGIFVIDQKPHENAANYAHDQDLSSSKRSRQKKIQDDQSNRGLRLNEWPRASQLNTNSWWTPEPKIIRQGAQPARIFGKKVAGHYKDFTSEPALGGTAAVTSWDTAHKAELQDDEVLRVQHHSLNQQQDQFQPVVGGALVWPTTEDGQRVVWQQYQ